MDLRGYWTVLKLKRPCGTGVWKSVSRTLSEAHTFKMWTSGLKVVETICKFKASVEEYIGALRYDTS